MLRKDKLKLIQLFKKWLEIGIEHDKGSIDNTTFEQKIKEIDRKIDVLIKAYKNKQH